MKDDEIKKAVREGYASVATRGAACCGTGTDEAVMGSNCCGTDTAEAGR